MTRIVLAICLMLSVASCVQTEDEPLPKETMVKLLTDIHLSEVYGTMVNDSLHKTINRNMDSVGLYYKSILAHHDVTIDEFKNSLDWYSNHPIDLDSVYITVQNNLMQLESAVNSDH